MSAHAGVPRYHGRREETSGAGLKVLAVLLGVGLGILIPLAIWLAASAQDARNDARHATAKSSTSTSMAGMPGMAASGEGAVASPSFAGIAPPNAAAIATAHRSFPAELPAVPAGPVANVHLNIVHRVITIARASATKAGPSTAPRPVL